MGRRCYQRRLMKEIRYLEIQVNGIDFTNNFDTKSWRALLQQMPIQLFIPKQILSFRNSFLWPYERVIWFLQNPL